jgi:hypothetical protein
MLEKQMGYATTISTAFHAKLWPQQQERSTPNFLPIVISRELAIPITSQISGNESNFCLKN